MRIKSVLIILMVLCSLSVGAQRIVYIQTVNDEIPTCDYVKAPEGSMGYTCINQTKVPCRITIKENGQTLFDSGDYEKSVSGATIHINGNTSSLAKLKPYKLKLQKKADMLSRGDSKYDDKNWRLIVNNKNIKTIIGFQISALLHFDWTPSFVPCLVYINDKYQGSYLLIESVERNNECRINVDKKTGYIVERDAYWWKESVYFATDYFESYKAYRWTWKYPDDEDVTEGYEDYIKEFINKTEESIIQGDYEQYIDVRSFARWILAHDIMGTWDSGGSNLYIAKYDNTDESRLTMPVLWDFDTICEMKPGGFSRYHDSESDFYFPLLFNSDNRLFAETYKKLWNDFKPSLLTGIVNFINAYSTYADGKETITWFQNHLDKLDEKIQNIKDATTIETSLHTLTDYNTYNLSGMQITKPGKGIYIKNHKLYYQK